MSRLRAGESTELRLSRCDGSGNRIWRELVRDCGGFEFELVMHGSAKAGEEDLEKEYSVASCDFPLSMTCALAVICWILSSTHQLHQMLYKPVCYSYLLPNTAASRHVHVSGPEETNTESICNGMESISKQPQRPPQDPASRKRCGGAPPRWPRLLHVFCLIRAMLMRSHMIMTNLPNR